MNTQLMNENLDLPVKKVKLSNKRMKDIIADEIMNWIIEGKLNPGQRIIEDEIAKIFGVSRMPAREAIHILESRGLVDYVPYVGASIKKLEPERIKEVYMLRCMLEPVACRFAAEKVNSDVINKVEIIQEELENIVDQPNGLKSTQQIYTKNRQFHMTIYETSEMPILLRIIDMLWDEIAILRIKMAYSENYPTRMKKEHRLYISLLKEHNGEKLATSLKENLEIHANEYTPGFNFLLL